ncbi:MAG: fibronectin type III domain-containing protein [Gaiellaceae bacterium]
MTAATSSSCTDTLAPTTPGNLTATAASQTSISALWSPSFDNVGVNGYDVFLNDKKIGSTPLTGYTFSGLACGTNYTLGIAAYDAAGNHSPRASVVAATSACPDLQAPSPPSNLTKTGTSETNVFLSWSASTDNVGVVGYDIYRNGSKLGNTASTSYSFDGLACGTTYTLGVAAYDAAGNHSAVASLNAATSACSSASDPVIAAAGDICWTDSTSCSGTATLLDQINPDAVLTLGDNQYNDGALSDYTTYYRPQWGRHDFHVYPSPGNHEFHIANAQGYRDYYGARAPSLTYSYDLGAWHLVSLAGASISVSTQNAWLQNDLASHARQCILAYWHEPRFSSGTSHGSNSSMGPLWTTLYNAHAAVVLNGHEHMYERFAPQNPSGVADPNGIREFVVGTGGVLGGYGIGTPIVNSEVRNNDSAGVIKLTLHPTGYDWQFVPQAGKTFTDSGSGVCPGESQPPPTIQSRSITFARSWAKRIPGSESSLFDVLKLFNVFGFRT